MIDPRTACWAGLLLAACETGGDSAASGDCDRAWGTLLTPAKQDVEVMDYDGPNHVLINYETARIYESDASDMFDGCNGSRSVVSFER